MKAALKRLVPAGVIRHALPHALKRRAARHGIRMTIGRDRIDLIKGTTVLRLSADHAVYVPDAIESFDYYVGAVIPFKVRGMDVVDYSTPRYHDVIGFDEFPICFPSLAEPIVTASQYLEFAALSPGMTVLDLGAYSGLTSILFARQVGAAGTVVAIEADAANVECLRRNLANHAKHSQARIELCEGAVWSTDGELAFSSEGNMGSSAATIVGGNRGAVRQVPSYTLNTIARRYHLSRVDFIKCDVEGAERVIFKNDAFFERFLPRIVIEPHVIDGVETTAECVADLERYGYRCERITQHGVPLPLLQCVPVDR
jgi:FkbM family methyltransferase